MYLSPPPLICMVCVYFNVIFEYFTIALVYSTVRLKLPFMCIWTTHFSHFAALLNL